MENQNVQTTLCDIKTDLNLLLECLKYQMDCPLSQKEALITIYSICQQNSEASEYFREIGGLRFINDLAKSSIHCVVKEAALFTLGIIIESNVYCQQSLCTSALFEDLILVLINKDSGVNLKRMSVYVILVLVSNNKYGQTYVRETGCIGLLLQLFRTTLSTSEMNLSDENTYQSYQLWSSVCSTLCACVNNPQNEDNQSICCAVFPYAKEWLESCTEPEIVRPICSFVGLTVANNSTVQKYFVSVGGLDTLAKVLNKLMHDSCISQSSTKLAVVVTKTLDACIANDSAMGGTLAKYHTVSELLNLLSNDTLDTGEKMSIILTIGHCTEVCEENQYELLKNNGLPLMIQVLTESQDEELNKAATFVLQNCKQMTEQLSLKINESSLNEKNADKLEADMQIRERSLQDYWKKAREILHRIKLIEKEHDEERMQGRVFVDRPSENSIEATKYHEMNPSHPETYVERTHKETCYPRLMSNLDGQVLALAVNSPLKNETVNAMNPVNTSTRKSEQNDIPRPVYEVQRDSVLQSHRINEKTGCEKRQSILQVQKDLFKQPAKTVRNMKQACTSGCTTAGLSVNSKTFSKMLRTCPYLCYHHKVVLEAEERYKKELQKLSVSHISGYAAFEQILLTPIKKGKLHTETSTFKSKKDNVQSILLTPIRKNKPDTSHRDEHNKNTRLPEEYNLLPIYEKSFQKKQDANLKRQCVKEKHSQECQQLKENCIYSLDEDEQNKYWQNNERDSLDINIRTLNKKRRIRKDFTDEEINYLLTGVKEMGHHWNLILWSYPFQEGRTNVDLSSKYYKLQRQEKNKSRQ
ncbi:telomere repeats-binding bouquet formation protein 1 isoform X3 [Anas platyrhynchos]|uniref:telomere repeats-binding bouquet formation protein 1 isoform X3 n=1 Tax=Anas platyrhynchos TaxID=8839 RepID=UPI003AF2A437